jgi:hypothetical protein
MAFLERASTWSGTSAAEVPAPTALTGGLACDQQFGPGGLRGRNRVARTLINWVRLGARLPGVSLRPVEVNGGPGSLVLDGQQRLILISVWVIDIAGGPITSISPIGNPDKLMHLGPVADFRSLLRSARWTPALLAERDRQFR